MNIKSIVSKNIYIYEMAAKIGYAKENSYVSSLIKDASNIDSINDYYEFKKIITEYKKSRNDNFVYMVRSYFADSRMYGHLESLYRYAGVSKPINYYAFSMVEHGTFVPTNGIDKNLINLHSNILLMGTYKSKNIHRVNPYKPVFVVGPYIHYAEPIYQYSKIEEFKKSFGKTLLVFPNHTYEGCGSEQNDAAFVDYVMNKIAKDYDTVLVSVYWNDVGENVFNMFEQAGAKLVSSGFRGDANFIRRLKTLFSLADDVCSNSFGTHVGYSIYEGKRFKYFDSNVCLVNRGNDVDNTELKEGDELRKWVKVCFENNETGFLSEEHFSSYESMWGGSKAIKSEKDMKDIITIGETLIERSKGFTGAFDKVVKELMKDGTLSDNQLYLLNNALGDESGK